MDGTPMTDAEKKELEEAVAELRRLQAEFAAGSTGVEKRQREALGRIAAAFEQAKVAKLRDGIADL